MSAKWRPSCISLNVLKYIHTMLTLCPQQMLHSVRRQQVEVDAHSAHSGDGDSGRGGSDEGDNRTSPRAKPPADQGTVEPIDNNIGYVMCEWCIC